MKKITNKTNLLTSLAMILFMVFVVSCGNKSGDDTNTGAEGIVDVSTIDPNKSNELQKISFLQESVGVVRGNTRELRLVFNPSSSPNKNVTWQSSNDAVATVANGIVTGKAAGTAYITVTSTANKEISATATVKVMTTAKNATAIEIGEIGGGSYYIPSNEGSMQSSKQLAVKLTPEDATDEITWKSSDATIASITADGFVKFIKEGNVTITAISKTNSSITKTHNFTVKPTGTVETAVAKNLRFWLTTIDPQIARIGTRLSGKLIYSSSNPSVVSVHTDSGMLTALAVGTANITIKDAQGNTLIYKVRVKDIPLVKVTGTVSGNLPTNPIVYMYAYLEGNVPLYFLAEIKNNQYSFSVPKDSMGIQGGISQAKGNNLGYYEFLSKVQWQYHLQAPTVMPALQAYNLYKIKLEFPLQDYKQQIYSQVVDSSSSQKYAKFDGERQVVAGRTVAYVKAKTAANNAKLKVWLFKTNQSGGSEPLWTPNTGGGGSTPTVGDATAVYFKEVALNTTTVSLTSSDELKWSKINITGSGDAAQNDSVSVMQAILGDNEGDGFQWQRMGSCSLDASKQCSLMVLPGSYKMGLQTDIHGGTAMPKLSMPIKNKTDLTYFNGLTPVATGNGTTVDKTFRLTQTQEGTLTATIQTPQNMDGKWFHFYVSGLTPRVNAKMVDTTNYASNKLKAGVQQSDGSYRYQIKAKLPKVNLDTEISLEADSYRKIVTKNLNANLNLGVVKLEE